MKTAPERILVVDDDVSTLTLFQHILEKEGYEVVCATSGEEALQQLKTQRRDLAPGQVGGGQQRHGGDPGGVGHGQGVDSRGHSSAEAAGRSALRGDRLWHAARALAGERTLRACAGRLHWGQPGQEGAV